MALTRRKCKTNSCLCWTSSFDEVGEDASHPPAVVDEILGMGKTRLIEPGGSAPHPQEKCNIDISRFTAIVDASSQKQSRPLIAKTKEL